MKKISALILLIALMVSLVACSGDKDESDQSLNYIKKRETFIVGLDDSFPPMGFRDEEDNIVGFDIDLAEAVAEKLGLELVLQPIDWTAKDQELNTKNIDCIWNGFSINEERLAQVTMSKPYLGNTISLVVVNDGSIETLDDMAGKRLALQSGSSAEDALNLKGNKELKDSLGEINAFATYEIALLDLETANSDAVLMDSVAANYMIQEAKKDFIILDESLIAEEYAIGFRKGEYELCKAVEEALSELKEEGIVGEISTKWFGSDVTLIQ